MKKQTIEIWLISLFILLTAFNLSAQEYRLSTVRRYDIYGDLKYLQTIEQHIYNAEGQLGRIETYKLIGNGGIELIASQVFTYENNFLTKEEFIRGDTTDWWEYEYNEEGLLYRKILYRNKEISPFNTVYYEYDGNLLVTEGTFIRKTYYEYEKNSEQIEKKIIQSSDGTIEYRNFYDNENLTKVEVYRISEGKEELLSYTENVFDAEYRISNTKNFYPSYLTGNIVLGSYSITEYNSIGEKASEHLYTTKDGWDPTNYEFYEKIIDSLYEYSYTIINSP